MSVLIERLDKNEIDICLGDIRYVAASEERYASKKLAINKLVVCCRRGHPLSGTGRVTPRDLLTYRLALSRTSPAIDRELHACFGLEASEKIPMVIECDDLGVLANLVATTELIGILPSQVFETYSGSLEHPRSRRPVEPVQLRARNLAQEQDPVAFGHQGPGPGEEDCPGLNSSHRRDARPVPAEFLGLLECPVRRRQRRLEAASPTNDCICRC